MDLASMTPLSGGWSGATFLADVAGERSVVRIYAPDAGLRGDAAHEVDAALLRLVRGLVPVPDVLEARRADPATEAPALLVTAYVEGARGDELLPTLADPDLALVGGRLGELLAVLGGMPMLRPGPFVDGDLRIGDFGVDGLPEYVAATDLPGFTAAELDGLRGVAFEAQQLLDTVGRYCLVHSDFNPKNLILDPDTLEVRALLDWEFAHAGHPFTDLGNLLRFDRQPAYVDAVVTAYVDRRGGNPATVLELARAADLWALVELAGRAGQNPVADRAHALLRAIARTGHIDAIP